MGLSGLEGSVRQNTSASPSDASLRCGDNEPVILAVMLALTIWMYWCAMNAGNSSLASASNAASTLASSAWLIVDLRGLCVKSKTFDRIQPFADGISIVYCT